MPSKSKAQQKFMGMVHQCKKTGKCASPEVKKVAKTMKAKDAEDFASTKHKGLPERKKKKTKKKVKESMVVEKMSEVFDPEFANDVNYFLKTGRGSIDALMNRFKGLFVNKLTKDPKYVVLNNKIKDNWILSDKDPRTFLANITSLINNQKGLWHLGEDTMKENMVALINDLCNKEYSSAREKLGEIVNLKIKDRIKTAAEAEEDSKN